MEDGKMNPLDFHGLCSTLTLQILHQLCSHRCSPITKVEMARHFSRSDRARVVNVWGKASYGPWPQVCSGSDSTY